MPDQPLPSTSAAESYHSDASSSSSFTSTSTEASNDPPTRSPPSPTTLFEDSLFSLFAYNQPARGNPGEERRFSHPNLPRRHARRQRQGGGEGGVEVMNEDDNDDVKSAPSRRRRMRRHTELRYRIVQNDGTNTRLFAHHQWDAGLYMSQLIADQSSSSGGGQQREEDEDQGQTKGEGKGTGGCFDLRNKTVVELGAGTGLPSLISALMGARRTVVTDYPDAAILSNLHSNVDLALSHSEGRECSEAFSRARSSITVEGLEWGQRGDEDRVLSHLRNGKEQEEGFERVLAADVLWLSSAHDALIHTLRRLLARSSQARILLIAGFHTGRPAVGRFFHALARSPSDDNGEDKAGVKAGIVPDSEEPRFKGVWERSVDGEEREWSGPILPTTTTTGRCGSTTSTSREETVEPAGGNEEEEEEMGDPSERGRWVVVASLRWADL